MDQLGRGAQALSEVKTNLITIHLNELNYKMVGILGIYWMLTGPCAPETGCGSPHQRLKTF